MFENWDQKIQKNLFSNRTEKKENKVIAIFAEDLFVD